MILRKFVKSWCTDRGIGRYGLIFQQIEESSTSGIVNIMDIGEKSKTAPLGVFEKSFLENTVSYF